MRQKLTFALLIFFSINIFAQSNELLKKYYDYSILFVKQKKYEQALDYALKTLDYNPENANYNYITGVCYLNTDYQKHKALPYLLKASQNIDKQAVAPNYRNETAPPDVLLYLSQAYYYNYKFFKAMESIKEFQKIAPNYSTTKLDNFRKKYITAARICNNHVHFETKHLSKTVNTKNSETNIASSVDEKTIIVTSIDSLGKTHITQYTKNEGKYNNPKNLDKILNPKNNARVVALSANGDIAILEMKGDLYISENIGEWSMPEKLPQSINSKYSEKSASLSIDGRTLYFSSDRPGGMGGFDIYYSELMPNNQWSKAKNIGSPINTKYDENYCNIHADNITLSYSSNQENTIGGYDLFFSERNQNGTWSEPQNYGYPVNTVYDDANFVFTYDNRNAFFTTQKDNSYGKKDIYKIKILAYQENSSAVVKGVVKDAKGNVLSDKIIHLTNRENGKYIGQYKAGSNGVYTFILTPGSKYFISFDDESLNFSPKMISVPSKASFSQIGKAIDLGTITTIE